MIGVKDYIKCIFIISKCVFWRNCWKDTVQELPYLLYLLDSLNTVQRIILGWLE